MVHCVLSRRVTIGCCSPARPGDYEVQVRACELQQFCAHMLDSGQAGDSLTQALVGVWKNKIKPVATNRKQLKVSVCRGMVMRKLCA